jgi:hypothetical protein
MPQVVEIGLPTYQDILDNDDGSPPPAYSCLFLGDDDDDDVEEEIDLPTYQDFLDDLFPPPDYSDVFPEKQHHGILKHLCRVLEIIVAFFVFFVLAIGAVVLFGLVVWGLWAFVWTITHA